MNTIRTLVFTDDQLEAALARWQPLGDAYPDELQRATVRRFLRSSAARKLYVEATHPTHDGDTDHDPSPTRKR